MGKYIQCWCPSCNRNTLHEIYTVDEWTGKRTNVGERIFHSIFTIGLGTFDFYKVCQCMDCGHIKRKNND